MILGIDALKDSLHNALIPRRKGTKMKITFNTFTMQIVALKFNGLVIIEHFGRFLVAKEHLGTYKVFFNTSDLKQAFTYMNAM